MKGSIFPGLSTVTLWISRWRSKSGRWRNLARHEFLNLEEIFSTANNKTPANIFFFWVMGVGSSILILSFRKNSGITDIKKQQQDIRVHFVTHRAPKLGIQNLFKVKRWSFFSLLPIVIVCRFLIAITLLLWSIYGMYFEDVKNTN